MAKHVVRQMKKAEFRRYREPFKRPKRTERHGKSLRTDRRKAANLLQAKQWGIEYGRHGIRVVSVSPGAIDTPLVRG